MLRLRSTLPAPGRKETKSRNTSLSQIMDYLHRQPERGERGVKGVTSHEKRRRRPLSRAFHFLFLFVLSDRNAAALLVRAFSDMFLQRDANLSLRRKFKKTKKNSGRNEYKAVCLETLSSPVFSWQPGKGVIYISGRRNKKEMSCSFSFSQLDFWKTLEKASLLSSHCSPDEESIRTLIHPYTLSSAVTAHSNKLSVSYSRCSLSWVLPLRLHQHLQTQVRAAK